MTGTTEGVTLTASAYTIAGALVGAGVGEPSPWAFEVRVAAAASAGYQAIGLFECDYSAMIAAGTDDEKPRTILDRYGVVVAEIEFFFDWAHSDEMASRSSAMGEALIHMAEAFRPHHVSVDEVRSPQELPPARGDPVEDTTRRRLLPGHGEFDLVGLLTALRELGVDASMGVEVLSEQQAAMDPAEAARASFDAAMLVLARAGYT